MLYGLVSVAKMDHADADCLFVAVFTHGEKNGTVHARDTAYNFSSIWGEFVGRRCVSLAGKPKVFLVQACRGGDALPSAAGETSFRGGRLASLAGATGAAGGGR